MLGDWLNIILAVILFLTSIRSLFVDYSRLDKSSSKFLKTIFAKNEQITADRILEKLGYASSEKALFRKNARKMQERPTLESLVRILADSTIKSTDKDGVVFGSHKSSYYVDSMGIAHDEEVCHEMNKILWQLIRKNDKKIDYIFSLKEANMCLAASFDKECDDIFSIIAKSPADKSYARESDELIAAYVNFEGFQVLIDKARNSPSLHGVAIACNLSNGSSMLKRIMAYNNTIKELNGRGYLPESVKPIDKVFILYRAVAEDKEALKLENVLDKQFLDAGIKCYRFFDLNEAKKAELYLIKRGEKNLTDFSCIQCIRKSKKVTCTAAYCWKKIH